MEKNFKLFSLKGKTALLTGATGYLGFSIAKGLAEAGAHVLVNSRSESRANEVVLNLEKLGYSAETKIFNVCSQVEIENALKNFSNNPLNIVINNAYQGGGATIKTARTEDYKKSYDVTVTAANNIIRVTLPSLRMAVKQTGYASIINIASMYAMVSPDQEIYSNFDYPNPPYYGTSKAALIQWTRYAACELGREKIRVNSLSPGPFPSTKIQKKFPEFIVKLAKKVPLGRIGQREEVVGPILFLASEASSYVNGANLVVDGGWTAW